MRLIDRLNCAFGNHKYRAIDIKCVMLDKDNMSVDQTCKFCGATVHFLTRLYTMEQYMEQLCRELNLDKGPSCYACTKLSCFRRTTKVPKDCNIAGCPLKTEPPKEDDDAEQ